MAVRGATSLNRRNLRFDVPGRGESGDFPHKAAVLGGRIIWIKSRCVKKIALRNHSHGFTFFGHAFPHPYSRSEPDRQHRIHKVGLNNALAFPAGGYMSEMVVAALPPGVKPNVFNPNDVYNDESGEGTQTLALPYRTFEMGLTVPPSVKMRIAEQTLDMGDEAHGTGYAPRKPNATTAGGPFNLDAYAFAPTGSRHTPGRSVRRTARGCSQLEA